MWIDRVTEDDYPAVLDANETAIPQVNSLSPGLLDDLARQAFYFRVARDEEGLVGFLLALSQDASYGSPNFHWFRVRYPRFVYIDRIVVAASARRSGIGRALYADLERAAAASAPLLACEVNIDPPNPGSMAFHERFGFAEVGRQYTGGGSKLVSLMVKNLLQEVHMRPQPLIAVTDVETSSRWYQRLLGCQSAHGGHEYERLVVDGQLILQLHNFEVEHHHGPIGDRNDKPYGNGLLLWFETDDFDGALSRAQEMGAEIVMPRHRNPPEGDGGPNHWECWLRDPDGYVVVLASPDGSAGEIA